VTGHPADGTTFLTVADSAALAREVAFFERACAHVLAGWAPKVSDVDIKLTLGGHVGRSMEVANAFRRRAYGLTGAVGTNAVPLGWAELVRAVDGASSPMAMLAGVYLVLKQNMVERLERHLESSDPVADAATCRIASGARDQLAEQVAWAAAVTQGADGGEVAKARGHTQVLWDARNTAALTSDDNPLVARDRVPEVARPHWMVRGTLGALRVLPMNPLHEPRDIGIFLHNFLNEEITTMELVCRNSYEHPEMPWEFHADAARHAEDESRHARLVWRTARLFGIDYGDMPIYTSSYEGQYQFAPCQPGSTRELLWRLLLRQTFHEGLALDSLAFEVRKRRFLHQDELARVFEFLLADEVFHARSGLTWSRHLCRGDPDRVNAEREAAHSYFVDRVKQTRAEFVAENLDAALSEIDLLERMETAPTVPFERELNTAAREAAGFTDEEISQLIGWGYVRPARDEAAHRHGA
jgi:uncharacterized ferritin-like protein (DUF455 family)